MRWLMVCVLAVVMTACSHGPGRVGTPATSTLRVPAHARVLVFAPHPDECAGQTTGRRTRAEPRQCGDERSRRHQ